MEQDEVNVLHVYISFPKMRIHSFIEIPSMFLFTSQSTPDDSENLVT
jgi:hypothetical protein